MDRKFKLKQRVFARTPGGPKFSGTIEEYGDFGLYWVRYDSSRPGHYPNAIIHSEKELEAMPEDEKNSPQCLQGV